MPEPKVCPDCGATLVDRRGVRCGPCAGIRQSAQKREASRRKRAADKQG